MQRSREESRNRNFEIACSEIAQNILDMENPSTNNVRQEIKNICSKYRLGSIPKNYEILDCVRGEDFDRLRHVLVQKPVKTSSGVAVVALMPKPYACPHGRCTYCPGGTEYNTPNSYTGQEPATISAIENHYSPEKQIIEKINKLRANGHSISKLEIVIVGGTFLFMPKTYQQDFVKRCYDALNGFTSNNLEAAKKENETAHVRNVGFTIETKPDYCKKSHVDTMLEYGVTRTEIGVQTLHQNVYDIVNRGHSLEDVIESFQIAKDAGYKIVAHMMPGLPTVTPNEDILDFKTLFNDGRFKPDMLKIYPTLVLENTPLYDLYKAGQYIPYSEDEMIHVLKEVKKMVPRWIRIMRLQREIATQNIVAGPKMGNLRQMLHVKLKEENQSCKCIRCREFSISDEYGSGLSKNKHGTYYYDNDDVNSSQLMLKSERYRSSGGEEVFLSYEDNPQKIYGFLRLRKPSPIAHREEIEDNTCIVRELHVYGKAVEVGYTDHAKYNQQTQTRQHTGLGKNLMKEAERTAREDFGAKKMLVISAVGTRQYYNRLGYWKEGPYMAKKLTGGLSSSG